MSKIEVGLDSLQAATRREQILALQASVPTSLIVGMLVCVLLAWLIAPAGERGIAVGWIALMCLGTLARLALWWRVRGRARSHDLDGTDLRLCRLSALIGGLAWAAVAMDVLQAGNGYQPHLNLVLAGVAAGGVVGKAADIVSVRLFLWPYLLPPVLMWISGSQQLDARLMATWLLFLIFLDAAAARAVASFRDLVRLRVLDVRRRHELERLHAEQRSLLRLQSAIIAGEPRDSMLALALEESIALSGARQGELLTAAADVSSSVPATVRRIVVPIDGRGVDGLAIALDFAADDPSAANAPERLRLLLRVASQGLLVGRELVRRSKIERELAFARERLDSILSAAEVAAWDIDVDRWVVRADARWAAITRAGPDVDPACVPIARALELLHTDDVARWRAGLDSLLAGSVEYLQVESRLRAQQSGEPLWVADRARVTERDRYGRPLRIAGIRVDATTRRRHHAQAEALLHRLTKLSEQIPGVIYQFQLRPDGTSAFPFSSERIREVYRVSPDEVREDAAVFFERLHPDDLEAVTQSIERSARELSEWHHQYRVRFDDGEVRWLEGRATPERLEDGSTLWHGFITDVTERKAMEQALTAQARTDRLTGLANRLAILERLDQICREQHVLADAVPFALLLLDFDNFKFVNDTLGHEAGDDLLRQVATRLQSTLQRIESATDGLHAAMVGRLGGDEFVVILEGLHGEQALHAATARVLEALTPPYTISGTEVTSTASIGIVLADRRYVTGGAILRDADVAMYEAKRSGRARARVFDAALSQAVERRRRLEVDLGNAAMRGELQLVYQPVFDLHDGTPVSVEALLRWLHPELGPISPTEFVPIAEEAGLIGAIGQWVLREACRQLAEWRDRGADWLPATVAVNVSRQQLARGESLVNEVLDALHEASLEPQALIVEVTEREVMAAETAVRTALRGLRAAGVRVAVDDFGVGVSSLSCLHEFPLSMIKIDRSFVREIESRRELSAVVSSVLLLADRLGLLCVAEGIETASQLSALRALGCGYGQGYLFSAPLVPAALVELLRERSRELELGAHHAA